METKILRFIPNQWKDKKWIHALLSTANQVWAQKEAEVVAIIKWGEINNCTQFQLNQKRTMRNLLVT